jgi:SagB-type dehydrogenase family enzyme
MGQNLETKQAWLYHDVTKHSYWSIRTSPHYLDWANQPSPFKIYPKLDQVALPRDFTETGAPALDVIASTGTQTESESKPTLDQLSTILFYSAGVTKQKTYPGGTIYFRAAACAGALYPTEIYVVCESFDGLAAGVYHFNPGDFSLRRLREGDHRNVLVEATASEPSLARAPVILVYTSISWRSTWKYRDRAYRYHFWDNGMIAANTLAMCDAHRLPAELVMGFIEADVNKLVGIDGKRELALSLLALGSSNQPAPPVSIAELPDLSLEVVPLSYSQVDYPSIEEIHAASSLAEPDEVSRWREASVDITTPDAGDRLVPLELPSQEDLPRATIEEVIARRASTRRFAHKPIRLSDLSIMLDRATRGIPTDFYGSPQEQLNDIYLIVNSVEGLAPGAYFYRRSERALELLKEGDFRERARYLTLEQDLGGDASVTIFFMADLNQLLAAFGNRGYRAAQMEAGLIGGKLYIATYSLKRGATGLTFYDDDVTSFFSPHAAGKSCIFVMSIGVPGKRPLF